FSFAWAWSCRGGWRAAYLLAAAFMPAASGPGWEAAMVYMCFFRLSAWYSPHRSVASFCLIAASLRAIAAVVAAVVSMVSKTTATTAITAIERGIIAAAMPPSAA